MLDEAGYDRLVAEALKRMVKALDAADPDALDADSTGDMLTVTGAKTGKKVVVNTQRAAHQLWVAGKGFGVHFSWDAASGRWLDDKGKGLELFAWVAECVEAASGQKLKL